MFSFVKPTTAWDAYNRISTALAALATLFFGALFVYVAFDGARMLPEFMSIVRFEYSASRALIVFMMGEILVAVSVACAVSAWRGDN